jgi:hypothetical protein
MNMPSVTLTDTPTGGVTTPITFASLPQLNEELGGGVFKGVTTQNDGTHTAVVQLTEFGVGMTHKQAMDDARKRGGKLPSKAEAALIVSKSKLPQGWWWTDEEYNASCAWGFDSNGTTGVPSKGAKGGALVVILIPIIA